MAPAYNKRTAWEQEQLARAAYYTATVFLGQGRYDCRRADSLEELEQLGRQMTAEQPKHRGGAMLYAINPEGQAIHIRNIERWEL